MAAFDLLIRGGRVVDGTGAPARSADVGVLGDRIVAVGDLGAVDVRNVPRVIGADGLVVAPGFIDPHGHSDASLLVDGALVSHLAQGFTTQLSGNCGMTVAPVTPAGRELVALELSVHEVVARWATFGEYFDVVDEVRLGPNVAFLAGHGTIRGSILGADAREPSAADLRSMVGLLESALDAGAFGLSTGLIYPPGIHARPEEIETLVAVTARRGGLYASHIRNEAGALFEALDEAIAAIRAAGDGGRLQVSHLKVGARALWGRAGEALERIERARAEGLEVAADQYPYTAAATSLHIVLPPALLALGVDECVAGLAEVGVRDRVKAEIARGASGWENVAVDPGWDAIRISHSPAHPDWAGRSVGAIAADDGRDPADVAFDALVDDRLETSIVLFCMDDADVEAIGRVPWVAICTDAEGRRPGHRILDAGIPHPRTYGTTARVLGTWVREQSLLPLEAAVAKLTSIPARRIGLRDRGVIRERAYADLVLFDPTTVADVATYEAPARHPAGIAHVVVNGRVAVSGGRETGERPGRLLRRTA